VDVSTEGGREGGVGEQLCVTMEGGKEGGREG